MKEKRRFGRKTEKNKKVEDIMTKS